MNLIPEDFDLTPAVGFELLQVCLGQYQIQLHFEGSGDGASCYIEGGGKVSLEVGGTSKELFHAKWSSSEGLGQLVGQSIRAWARRGPNHFSITFSSSASLVFETQESQYEDFTVQLGKMGVGPFWVL